MWFEELVGFEERSGKEVREHLSIEGDVLVSAKNGRRMRFGTLELASLADLRDCTATLGSDPTTLTLRQVVGEAGSLHVDPDNAGALFQAASQFNLLEMVSPDVTPEAGITGYEHDRTQGPACAIACGAGTIWRNYFVDVNGRVGQTADNQIDCLADLAIHLFPTSGPPWTMSNGYAMFNQPGLDRAQRTPRRTVTVRARRRPRTPAYRPASQRRSHHRPNRSHRDPGLLLGHPSCLQHAHADRFGAVRSARS